MPSRPTIFLRASIFISHGPDVDALAGPDGRVLFITPAAVISTWIAHAAQSHHDRDVRSLGGMNGGASVDCVASFMTGKHWLVVSYEYYSRHHMVFRKHVAARIALLVLDEAHFLGFDAARRERVLSCPADKVLALTATPCSNDLMQLWSLFDIVQPGFAGSAT
jgi:SNF2 family DNA or RNA helicase